MWWVFFPMSLLSNSAEYLILTVGGLSLMCWLQLRKCIFQHLGAVIMLLVLHVKINSEKKLIHYTELM